MDSNSAEGESANPTIKIAGRASYQTPPPPFMNRSALKKDLSSDSPRTTSEFASSKVNNSPKMALKQIDTPAENNEYIEENDSQSESYTDENEEENVSVRQGHDSSGNQSEENAIPEGVHQSKAKDSSNGICIFVVIVFGVLSFSLAHFFNTTGTTDSVTYQDINLQELFPSKNPDFWLTINAGINDVKKFNKPSVFIFLYSNLISEEYMDNLIHNVSVVASMQLDDGAGSPVIINGRDFNSPEAISDYGYNIAKYRPMLEENHVLSVKNLDLVKPKVARAFHTLCDDISPLVPKSLFFFTMKVEESAFKTKSENYLVLNQLKEKWRELPDDIFGPLYARVSNVILKVNPSK